MGKKLEIICHSESYKDEEWIKRITSKIRGISIETDLNFDIKKIKKKKMRPDNVYSIFGFQKSHNRSIEILYNEPKLGIKKFIVANQHERSDKSLIFQTGERLMNDFVLNYPNYDIPKPWSVAILWAIYDYYYKGKDEDEDNNLNLGNFSISVLEENLIRILREKGIYEFFNLETMPLYFESANKHLKAEVERVFGSS